MYLGMIYVGSSFRNQCVTISNLYPEFIEEKIGSVKAISTMKKFERIFFNQAISLSE
jgi:hypothetical protein